MGSSPSTYRDQPIPQHVPSLPRHPLDDRVAQRTGVVNAKRGLSPALRHHNLLAVPVPPCELFFAMVAIELHAAVHEKVEVCLEPISSPVENQKPRLQALAGVVLLRDGLPPHS